MLWGVPPCWWSLTPVFMGAAFLCLSHKTRSMSKTLKSALQEDTVSILLRFIKMNILSPTVAIFLVLTNYFMGVRVVLGHSEGWQARSRGQCHGWQGSTWLSDSTRSPDHRVNLWWWGRSEMKLGSQAAGQDQVWWGEVRSDTAQKAGPSWWEQSEAKLRSQSAGQVSRPVVPWPGPGMTWSALETIIPDR